MTNKSNVLLIKSELKKLKKMMKETCVSESVELTAIRTIMHMEDVLADLSVEVDDMKEQAD